jgi:hypothetical protein
VVRRERAPTGYVLRFSGEEATNDFLDEVLDSMQRLIGPAW